MQVFIILSLRIFIPSCCLLLSLSPLREMHNVRNRIMKKSGKLSETVLLSNVCRFKEQEYQTSGILVAKRHEPPKGSYLFA